MQLNQVLDSFFNRGFRGPRCKTLLKLATSRMKLLRNKRELQIKQMRRELAQLLQNGQEPTACIRVEHIIREQNTMEAYDTLELFCELIVVRLPIIESQRDCPLDLHEAVASLIFAAPRCADLPELLEVRNLFAVKYGREFVAAAAELRPDCRVNRRVIEKLSVRAPSAKAKLQFMKEIAEENDVEWDSSNIEADLFKLPEDLLDGPNHFVGATQMPIPASEEDESHFTPIDRPEDEPSLEEVESSLPSPPQGNLGSHVQAEASSDEQQFVPFLVPPSSEKSTPPNRFYSPPRENVSSQKLGLGENSLLSRSHSRTRSEGSMNFQDVIEAAEAAAESAERAARAARAAADLAKSKMSPKSSRQNKTGGLHHASSEVEEDAPSVIKPEASFTQDIGNQSFQNDIRYTSERPELNGKNQEEKTEREHEEPVSYDIFDINSENVQVGKQGRLARERGSVFDPNGDDYYNNTSTSYQQASAKGGSGIFDDTKFFTSSTDLPPPGHPDHPTNSNKEGGRPLYDQPSFDESSADTLKSSRHPQRLPSLDEDPYFSYPNLFSKPSPISTPSEDPNELHYDQVKSFSPSLAPSAPVNPDLGDVDNLYARFNALKFTS